MGIYGLTRENIQNSLDGKLLDNDDPVVLTVKTGTIHQDYIPGIKEIKQRITSLQGRNSYTKETITHMVNKMDLEEVAYISFEDSNTRGLTGARNGQSDSKEDTWAIYAYNKGVHFEEEDEAVETSRGGSHGVGKIASNAASDLHIMFFANCDKKGNQHLGGTVQLVEHKYNNQAYRSTGYFADIKSIGANKTKFYPFENRFHEVFEKKTRGLKIIIPYLREQYNDESDIIKSICDSFFISILENRLVVNVNDKVINRETIKDFVSDEKYYIQDIAEIKHEFTPLYIDTFLNVAPIPLTISDMENDYHFKLYFRYDEAIPKGRVAIVRTIGMKIEDKKVNNNVNKPFNAVLVAEKAEDGYLKSLENESHTQLAFDHIKDVRLQKNAKRFINSLSKEIAKIIEEAIKKNNKTDGMMDTKDILYLVENQFKQDLADAVATVKINKGKSLVKVTTDIPKKKKKNKPNDKEKPEKPRKKVKRVKPRSGNEGTNGDEERLKRYSAHPDIVERLLIGNKEVVQFDFNDSKEINGEKSCNISLSIIDGMGVEYKDEFKIKDNYNTVIDGTSGKQCKIENNLIKNIAINNGIAQLKLEPKPNFNKALKFVYYVEV
ncbi:hypothetical protein [Aquibacillus salsiterrae]|uniref:Uncharacterized protein n=1 Tax=Aquibacillus salsiterrae TaxID=2950439 RepID=A0A9X3WIN2_9BACI|nr:hypothetical protein [Aquibacillus salsiterrae]MDC3418084.1 hypothetical protein [Aquibacillus salsiterrae]